MVAPSYEHCLNITTRISFTKRSLFFYLNIYLNNSYLEKLTFSNLRFSESIKFDSKSVFGELQLTQISLNFKNLCCNLKMRGLGVKS